MELLNRFLSEYHFHKTHRVIIDAPPEAVYDAVLSLDLGKSRLIRMLFRLRGMPDTALSFEGLERSGFAVLGEEPGHELLLGIAGRFWTLKGDMQKIDSDNFTAFCEPGYAKAAWNFSLKETGAHGTELSTETRIFCTDSASRRRFGPYWFLIGPFSGWIRRKMLSIIKTDAERNHSAMKM